MTRLALLAIVVAAAACGSKGGSACDSAIAAGVDGAMSATAGKTLTKEMEERRQEIGTKLKATLAKRCTEDKWPTEVLDCFKGVTSRDAMIACQGKLPPEEQQKVMSDVMDVMRGGRGGNARGGMMPPGHPGDLQPAAPPSVPAPQPPAGSAAGSAH